MPESICGWILLGYRLPEWKWPTAMVMVFETLKISWNISLPATVQQDWDGVWIWEITTRCGLPTTLWGSSEAITKTFYKTLSSLVGFVMTMIGVCWAGIIKLIGGRSVFHTCCQEIKTCHIKQNVVCERGCVTRRESLAGSPYINRPVKFSPFCCDMFVVYRVWLKKVFQ